MTEVTFHFNVPDRLTHACRVVRKALGQGHRLIVTAPQERLVHFDQALWSFAPSEFLAHCGPEATPGMIAISPVVLATDLTASLPHRELLINLGDGVPAGFGQFGRLVEIVSQSDPIDRQAARARWKHYGDRGYPIVRHDLSAGG